MTLRVLIVDDEPLAREGLRFYLQAESDIQVIGEAGNGSEAIAQIIDLKPDLVFLDIKMPKLSGFDVIAAVGAARMPAVIFLTAFEDHALAAFRVHAIDYLLKPIEAERLQESLAHARRELLKTNIAERGQQLQALLQQLDGTTSKASTNSQSIDCDNAGRLLLRVGGHVYFLQPEEIIWIEAAGDYVTIYAEQRKHMLRATMAHMESKLSAHGFQRLHRSAIVNLNRIRELIANDAGDYEVVLKDNTRLKLSRHYRDALFARLGAIN